MPQLLSLYPRAWGSQQEKPQQREARHCNKEKSLLTATAEKPAWSNKDPACHKERNLFKKFCIKRVRKGLQWLKLCASTEGGTGVASSIPGQGTKIPHAWRCSQKLKKKKKLKYKIVGLHSASLHLPSFKTKENPKSAMETLTV